MKSWTDWAEGKKRQPEVSENRQKGTTFGEVVLVTRLLVGSRAGDLRSIGQRRRDCLRRKFNLHCRPVEKQLRRSQVMAFFERLPPCLVGMEACATAHHWARELRKLGHDVRLMPARDVKAYVKRNKNGAADAEAICEAVRRPTMRFITVKTAKQQGRLMQHRVRDQLMRQRTQQCPARAYG